MNPPISVKILPLWHHFADEVRRFNGLDEKNHIDGVTPLQRNKQLRLCQRPLTGASLVGAAGERQPIADPGVYDDGLYRTLEASPTKLAQVISNNCNSSLGGSFLTAIGSPPGPKIGVAKWPPS